MTRFFQRRSKFFVELEQGSGDTMSTGFCLSVNSAAFDFGDNVKLTFLFNSVERSFNHADSLIEAEVITQLFVVDLDFSFAFRKTYPGRGGLAPTGS